MVEIKPKKLKLIPQNLLKQKSAEDFCRTHNMSYEVVDPEVLSWEEMFELHKNHKIKFSKTTEIKFQSLLTRKTRNETE